MRTCLASDDHVRVLRSEAENYEESEGWEVLAQLAVGLSRDLNWEVKGVPPLPCDSIRNHRNYSGMTTNLHLL